MLFPILSLITLLVSVALLAYVRRGPEWSCPRCGRELHRAEARHAAWAGLRPLASHCGGCGWSGRSRAGAVPRLLRVPMDTGRRA
jgi:hypothetical protein